ncbi:MAG: site-specific DNA-methyltransferase [Chloroflexi bacterium]|nr:site-specific DNA-methyltransferase [Chloroflexota bacterium]
MPVDLAVEKKIRVRAVANDWISRSFPTHRKYLLHTSPKYSASDNAWTMSISTRNLNGHSVPVGSLVIDGKDEEIVDAPDIAGVQERLLTLLSGEEELPTLDEAQIGHNFEFRLGDGLVGANSLPDKSIDLLLTDPPYGISKGYTCESQVPRRLRKDGTDFIMPKGNFGDWDKPISPREWTQGVLPKVRGWFVTFCAQAQIGEYCEILKDHKFVAVGTLVWQKTNPVPFNHRYKPINAWEALVVGKRSGTKFNGHVVHNVFVHKSPSPQQRIHTTQKPLPLIERFVELFSDKGDFVFDPFAGSATTVVAAAGLGRTVLAYEKDPTIYQSACKRLAALKG